MFSQTNQYSINHTNRTEGQTEIYNITWTIANFIKILDCKTTREFRTRIREDSVNDVSVNSKFQLKMLFVGRQNDLIEMYYLSPTSVFLKSVLTICLKRFEERSIIIKEYQTVQANKWQYLATLFKRDIVSFEGRDTFLLNDGSLRMKFHFMVSTDVRVDRPNIPASQLSDDFGSLLIDGSYSDVIMKSVECEEFKVHKPVLAIRSEVLKAHFEHNTTESITNVIETPLESEVLREVLTFVYTDKAPRVDEIPERLLAAADYYQLSRLKSLCEEALHKKLSVENAIDTLQLAELHSAQYLRQTTLEFIKDGQAKLITQTQGWAKVQSVQLIKMIYEFIMADEIKDDLR